MMEHCDHLSSMTAQDVKTYIFQPLIDLHVSTPCLFLLYWATVERLEERVRQCMQSQIFAYDENAWQE
jgi:hypothetical protein